MRVSVADAAADRGARTGPRCRADRYPGTDLDRHPRHRQSGSRHTDGVTVWQRLREPPGAAVDGVRPGGAGGAARRSSRPSDRGDAGRRVTWVWPIIPLTAVLSLPSRRGRATVLAVGAGFVALVWSAGESSYPVAGRGRASCSPRSPRTNAIRPWLRLDRGLVGAVCSLVVCVPNAGVAAVRRGMCSGELLATLLRSRLRNAAAHRGGRASCAVRRPGSSSAPTWPASCTTWSATTSPRWWCRPRPGRWATRRRGAADHRRPGTHGARRARRAGRAPARPGRAAVGVARHRGCSTSTSCWPSRCAGRGSRCPCGSRRTSGSTSADVLTVYRIAQEALTNVARHASARHAWVELGSPRRASSGCGSATTASAPPTPPRRGSGLLGIEERVAARGGTLGARARRPGGGTMLGVVPVPERR